MNFPLAEYLMECEMTKCVTSILAVIKSERSLSTHEVIQGLGKIILMILRLTMCDGIPLFLMIGEQ